MAVVVGHIAVVAVADSFVAVIKRIIAIATVEYIAIEACIAVVAVVAVGCIATEEVGSFEEFAASIAAVGCISDHAGMSMGFTERTGYDVIEYTDRRKG